MSQCLSRHAKGEGTSCALSTARVCAGGRAGGQRAQDDELGLFEGLGCARATAQVGVLEFSRERKMMSVRCRREGRDTLFLKGAPEAVLARCTQARPATNPMLTSS